MSNAEKFIQENTRYTYNYNSYAQDPEPWLTPDDARKAVEIAKEEVIEKVCKYLKRNYEDIGIRWMRGYEADDLVEALKNYLEE